MTIKHHPDDSTLMSYAAGSLSEALSVVVAAHVAVCPACAAEVRRMEALGAVLLGGLHGAKVDRPAPQLALRGIEADVGGRSKSAVTGDIPAPLQALAGERIDDIHWRRLGMGVWNVPLKLSGAGGGDLRLLKVAPGLAMPEHGHGGAELTMILRGSYRDQFGIYHPGDLADLGDEAEHQPIADANDGCICIVASEARARFKGWFARIVQPLTGF